MMYFAKSQQDINQRRSVSQLLPREPSRIKLICGPIEALYIAWLFAKVIGLKWPAYAYGIHIAQFKFTRIQMEHAQF